LISSPCKGNAQITIIPKTANPAYNSFFPGKWYVIHIVWQLGYGRQKLPKSDHRYNSVKLVIPNPSQIEYDKKPCRI